MRTTKDRGCIGKTWHGPVDVKGAVGEFPVEDVLAISREVVVGDIERVAADKCGNLGRVARHDRDKGSKRLVGTTVGARVEFGKWWVSSGCWTVTNDPAVRTILLRSLGTVTHVNPEIGVVGDVSISIHNDFVSLS